MFEQPRRRSARPAYSDPPTAEELQSRLQQLEVEERELEFELRTLNAEHRGLKNLLDVVRHLLGETTEKERDRPSTRSAKK